MWVVGKMGEIDQKIKRKRESVLCTRKLTIVFSWMFRPLCSAVFSILVNGTTASHFLRQESLSFNFPVKTIPVVNLSCIFHFYHPGPIYHHPSSVLYCFSSILFGFLILILFSCFAVYHTVFTQTTIQSPYDIL